MKKVLKLLSIFLLSIPLFIKAYAIDYNWANEKSLKLEKITISKIFQYDRIIDNKGYNAQGFAVTPTHFVFSLVGSDNDKSIICFVNRNTLKIDKMISDYIFGHANDFAYNSKTKQLVLPYILNDKQYVAYFDAVNLSYIKSEITDVITFALGYNSNDDKYYYRINSSTYTVDSNFKNIKEIFKNTDYGNTHLVKQGMAVNNNKLYYSLFEVGTEHFYQNGRYSRERRNDALIAISDTKGNYLKAYHIPIGDNRQEIESIDFDDNGQMYLLYNNNDTTLGIYKMNYANESINFKLNIIKNNIKDNMYRFKLLDGDKVIQEKSNIGNIITFENITISDTGTKDYTIVDSENNRKYNVKVNVTVDSFNKKLLPTISYDDKNELIINKDNEDNEQIINKTEDKNESTINNDSENDINKLHLTLSIISLVSIVIMITIFIIVFIKRKTK